MLRGANKKRKLDKFWSSKQSSYWVTFDLTSEGEWIACHCIWETSQGAGHWRLCFLKIVQNLKQFLKNMSFFHFICTNMRPNVLVAELPVFPWPCPLSLLNQFFTAVVRSTIYPCLRLLIMIKFSSFLAWVSIIWQKKGKYWVLKNGNFVHYLRFKGTPLHAHTAQLQETWFLFFSEPCWL